MKSLLHQNVQLYLYFKRVHSDCPNDDLSNYNVSTKNLSPTKVRTKIVQNRTFWTIAQKNDKNLNRNLDGRPLGRGLLSAPTARKPSLVLLLLVITPRRFGQFSFDRSWFDVFLLYKKCAKRQNKRNFLTNRNSDFCCQQIWTIRTFFQHIVIRTTARIPFKKHIKRIDFIRKCLFDSKTKVVKFSLQKIVITLFFLLQIRIYFNKSKFIKRF